MDKRAVVKIALQGQRPPYVPWQVSFTQEALAKLQTHFGREDVDTVLDNHFVGLGDSVGYFEPIGNDLYRDPFGVVWDRSVDKDIGVVTEPVLPEPTLDGYEFPDPASLIDPAPFREKLTTQADRFRCYYLGFSLYERAWTLRGMENLMMDFHLNPQFVHDLLDAIADHNIARIKLALQKDIDAVYTGDDWGQQTGLIMGPDIWREFIKPRVKRTFDVARAAGKFRYIHSCGKVDELFDDLIDMGLNCFNPFQPEVMDVHAIHAKYAPRLSFHGGLSTQQTLPYGTPDDVRQETRQLLKMGAPGNYLFAPAHAVEGDVPLENMLTFIEELKNQPGFNRSHG